MQQIVALTNIVQRHKGGIFNLTDLLLAPLLLWWHGAIIALVDPRWEVMDQITFNIMGSFKNFGKDTGSAKGLNTWIIVLQITKNSSKFNTRWHEILCGVLSTI